MAGVAWLREDFGADVSLKVEIAWGADVTDADGSSWVWTDITPDVRVSAGISLRVGKADEASTSQPASCELTLKNDNGDYSLGGMSANYPNVRRGTPVRISIDLDDAGGFRTVLQGGAAGFSPDWDTTGTIATVKLSVSGVLRRLGQGDVPVLSPYRRIVLNTDSVVAYWPCEDGVNAQHVQAAVGPYNMTFYSLEHPGGNPEEGASIPDFQAASDFICSDPILKLNGAELYGHLPGYDSSSNKIQLQCLVEFDNATDNTVILGLQTTGSSNTSVSCELWEIRYESATLINIRAWRRGALILDSHVLFNPDGFKGEMTLALEQDGADTFYEVDFLAEGADSAGLVTGTLTNCTFGVANRVQINTDGGNDGVTIGHVAFHNNWTTLFHSIDALNAYDGESVTGTDGRLQRLADENGISLTEYTGAADTDYLNKLGPQDRASLVALLREAELVDWGILWDGRDPGLSYTTRRYREAQAAALTVDARELLPPFLPVDDDQRTRNKMTANRKNGGFWTEEDATGPMGTGEIREYDDSETYNLWSDERLPDFASWAVAAGTIYGYRFPSLVIDVSKIPDRAAALLELVPGDRVDIENLHLVRSDMPAADIRLVVEGWSMRLDSHRWVVTLNASPHAVWNVGILEADVGSTQVAGEYVIHLDTDGSTLASSALAGATSLSVARTDSTYPLWTTDTNDFPFVLDVGGVPVTVTAISGASSPQTFTVSATPRAFAAGTEVKLWNPTRLAI